MYPPVMPSRALSPPWKPDSTGAPTAASRMKASTAMVPRLPPSRPTARNTPMVCRVKGMAVGMEIQEHTAMTATNTAI